MKKFAWHYDNGHEWLEVDIDYLKGMRIAGRISSYSYYDKTSNMAYLEGDMDAAILYKAMGEAWNNDNAPHIDHGEATENPIRNMSRFPIPS